MPDVAPTSLQKWWHWSGTALPSAPQGTRRQGKTGRSSPALFFGGWGVGLLLLCSSLVVPVYPGCREYSTSLNSLGRRYLPVCSSSSAPHQRRAALQLLSPVLRTTVLGLGNSWSKEMLQGVDGREFGKMLITAHATEKQENYSVLGTQNNNSQPYTSL